CRDISRTGRWRSPAYRSTSFLRSAFTLVVDGVLRDLDGEVLVADLRLAREARAGFQAPGLVEHVLLLLGGRRERVEALTHEHVAGGACRLLLARVLDVDVVLEQRVADRLAGLRLDLGAVGTDRMPGKDLQFRHRGVRLEAADPAPGEGPPDAFVH